MAKTLQDQGYRYIKRGEEFKWAHPAEVMPADVDCTDMTDDEFEAFVIAGVAP
jgi:hypothetical protein